MKFKTIKNSIKKHDSTILTVMAVTSLVTTVAMTVKATIKAKKLVEEAESKKGDKLTKKEVVKTTAKVYAPVILTTLVSGVCSICANRLASKKAAMLNTALSLVTDSAKEFANEVEKEIGKEKTDKIKEKIDKKKVLKQFDDQEIIYTGKGDTLCYDAWSGRYFKSDIDLVKKAVNDFNATFVADGSATLNDLYYLLGLPESEMGDNMGWDTTVLDRQMSCIDFRYSSQLNSKDEPVFVINHEIPDMLAYLFGK